MSWRRFYKRFLRRIGNVFKTYDQDKHVDLDQDVLKTSSEDVWLRRIYSSWSKCLEDVKKMPSEDEDEGHLQDIINTSSSKWMFAGSGLVKKADYNAKTSKIESKIPGISGLATKSALTAVENKIPKVSSLV